MYQCPIDSFSIWEYHCLCGKFRAAQGWRTTAMTKRITFLVLMVFILAGYQAVSSQKTSSPPKNPRSKTAGTFNGYELVDKTGNIRKPADYRDHFEILGTWFVLDPKGNQMHYTYASPGTAEYYRKNGKFADGTVLVKEVDATTHAQM